MRDARGLVGIKAETLSIMSAVLSITRLSITRLSITRLSITRLSITRLSITVLSTTESVVLG